MKLKIIGYLISHTDSENIWIELQKVYNDLCPEDDVEFEEDIFGLLNENRISYSHEYVGETISGYKELLLPAKELRKNKSIKF